MAIDPLEGFKTDGAIEDTSAVFGSYPAPDEPLFLSALPLFTPPTFDNANDLSHDFFSHTPLGWVQPGNETQIQSAETRTGPSPLTRDSRIRELTTQPAQQPFQPSSSPETTRNKKRKRKKSMADKSDDFSSPDLMSDTVKRSGRKTAHNMIEKRYRTNLNQKIAALRDAVPSLRATTKNSKGEDVLQEDLQGLAPAHKLNKVDHSPSSLFLPAPDL